MTSSIAARGLRRTGVAAALLIAFAIDAHAATISVNQDSDQHLFNQCSLREAIEAANTNATPPATNCAAGSGADDVIRIPFAQIVLVQGSLSPGGTVLIEGTAPGGKTVITRASASTTFSIFSTSGDVTLKHLQISGGVADLEGGGGGGGILNGGAMTLIDCTVSGNSSVTRGGGGGIYSFGPLTLVGSTVSGNTSSGWGGGIASKYNTTVIDSTISGNRGEQGGGIALFGLSNAALQMSNSTISDNSASNGNGGGLWVNIATSATVSNSTVAFNSTTSTFSGGGIYLNAGTNGAGTLAMSSTLVARNLSGKYAQDIGSAIATTIAGDHDLVPVVSALVTVPAGTLACAPALRGLGDNGGATATISLFSSSCAIDAGARNGLDFDQRGDGFARVNGPNADIGAFEYSDVIFADGVDHAVE